MEPSAGEGSYIYCIIGTERPVQLGPVGIGERGDEVYSAHFDGLAAVVSRSPIKSYTVARDNMMAHEKVIEEVMKEHAVLPVRFCTIARNDDEVREILRREHSRFSDLLKNIEGKKELGLRGFCNEGIYKDIVDKYSEIRELKEKIAALPAARTHSQRMEIGGMVEAALKREKELFREDILGVLSPLSVQTKTNNNYGDMMILNAAFLVEKSRERDFDRAVNELDAKYSGKIKFKYVGTLPPFNFVNVVIDLRRREEKNVPA